VNWRYKRHRAHSKFINIEWGHWADAAWWLYNHTSYEVETTAVWNWHTVCPPIGAPPVCGPWGKFYVHIWFTVNPDGTVESSAEFHKSWFN
jgi:hypothetical protein